MTLLSIFCSIFAIILLQIWKTYFEFIIQKFSKKDNFMDCSK
jgi:hypothetical protein